MGGDTSPIFKPIFFIWLAGSIMLSIAAWQNISSLSGWGPDDQLRLVQLRDFLSGQSWFDNSQHRLNAPYGSEMHWSRIVELPLALIVLLLSPIFGQLGAEMVAGVLVPLLLLLVTGYILADIARRIGRPEAAPVAMLLCFLLPTLLAQFMPMRIDHHGWQIMLAAMSLRTIFCADKRGNGLILGSAIALWLHISMEAAPLTAVFFGYLGWRWIFHRAHGERLLWALIAFAPLSALFFVATQGFVIRNHCDIVSPAHLAAIGTATVIMIAAIILRLNGSARRGAAAAFAGISALGLLYAFAPMCLTDGFAELDPLVRSYWYGSVTEGLPIWEQAQWGAIGWVMAAIFGLAGLIVLRSDVAVAQREQLRIIGWFQLASLAIALLVFRASAIACAFAIPVLANWLLRMIEIYRRSPRPLQKARTAVFIMLIVMAGPLAMQVLNKAQQIGKATSDQQAASAELAKTNCESVSSVAALGALKDARIVAPFDMGPAILLATPHSVLASSHHRNNAGMRDQIDIFRSAPTDASKVIIKRGITHLAICSDEDEMKQYAVRDPKGLWAQMRKGNVPSWLIYKGQVGAGIDLWRVAPE